jgi:hypothetical protein
MAEKSILDRIGLGLQGFGAGVGGRGPEFLAGLRQEQQQQQESLSKERQDALLKDAFIVSQHLQSGRIDSAINLLQNRVNNIQQLGGDPTDSAGLLQQIQSGDTEGALAELQPLIQFAQAEGRLNIPQEAQTRRELVDGQIIDIPPTGPVTAQDIEGFRRPAPEFKQQIIDGQVINLDPTTGQASAAPIPGFRKAQPDGFERMIKMRRLQLDEAKARGAMEKLTPGLEKVLFSSQDAAVESQRQAAQFNNLADDFERFVKSPSGLQVTAAEALKNMLGGRDELSRLRTEYDRVRISKAVENVAPPASDSDIANALKGFPPPNASAAEIASFLRGSAELSQMDAAYNQFKGDFISNKTTGRGLNQTWRKEIKPPKLNGQTINVSDIYIDSAKRGISPEKALEMLGLTEGDLY